MKKNKKVKEVTAWAVLYGNTIDWCCCHTDRMKILMITRSKKQALLESDGGKIIKVIIKPV